MKPTILPESFLRRMSAEDREPLGGAGVTQADAHDRWVIKSEKALQIHIAQWLGSQGIFAIHSRMDKRTTTKRGVPDFLFAIRGKATAIECKMPGEGLREDQVAVLAKLEKDGWITRRVESLREVVDLVIALREEAGK